MRLTIVINSVTSHCHPMFCRLYLHAFIVEWRPLRRRREARDETQSDHSSGSRSGCDTTSAGNEMGPQTPVQSSANLDARHKAYLCLPARAAHMFNILKNKALMELFCQLSWWVLKVFTTFGRWTGKRFFNYRVKLKSSSFFLFPTIH